MALLQPPSFLQNRTDHTAQEDRLYLEGLLNPIGGIGGIARNAGINLVRAQAAPNMTVIVAKERFFIPGTESTTQGMYHGYNDGDLTVTIAASSPGLARKDIICASIKDAFYSTASNLLVVDKVTGTPGSFPVTPSPPANAIVLATIDVAAGATTVTNANITISAQAACSNGGIIPVAGQVARDALVEYNGLTVYRMDLNSIEVYNGTFWDLVSNTGGFLGETQGTATVLITTANTSFAMADSKVQFTLAVQRRVRITARALGSAGAGNSIIKVFPAVVAGTTVTLTGAINGSGTQISIGTVGGPGASTIPNADGTFLLSAGTYSAFVITQCSTGTTSAALNGYCSVYDVGAI